MTVLRRLCLCLLMLALPLQGLAALTLQHCGNAAGVAAAVAGETAHTTHDHAAHLAAPAEAAVDDKDPQAGHQCAICAFCGHAVAITAAPEPLQFGAPGEATLPEPSVLIPALAALVPDKPPRG